MYSEKDGKPCYSDANRSDGEKETMTCEIGENRDEHCEREGASPGRNGMKLCLNGGETVGGYNTWCKECVAVCWDDHTEIHETS